jgi:phosphoenolpyruvate carboxylase
MGAELSISSELASVTKAVDRLAEESGDNNPTRRDEPYRRAISGCYARLAATYKKLTGRVPPRPASVSGEAYPDAESLRSDLLALEQSLESSSRGWLGRGGALARLIRAL